MSDSQPALVYCKPGTVHLWSPSSGSAVWSGDLTINLKTQKRSVGSSRLHPVTGLQYITGRDALIISLFDGSFHAIRNLSTSPTIEDDSENTLTSKLLSSAVRSVFSRVEQEQITFSDVNRTSGMVSYDDAGVLAWVHESVAISWLGALKADMNSSQSFSPRGFQLQA